MSHTYRVNGYVDVRIAIKEMDVSASQSTSSDQIAVLVADRVSNCMNCELIGHSLLIEK
jgi:hypothetical protein